MHIVDGTSFLMLIREDPLFQFCFSSSISQSQITVSEFTDSVDSGDIWFEDFDDIVNLEKREKSVDSIRAFTNVSEEVVLKLDCLQLDPKGENSGGRWTFYLLQATIKLMVQLSLETGVVLENMMGLCYP